MKRVESYVMGFNQHHRENFFLELLYHGADLSQASHLIIRCRPGVRCNIDATSWELFRAKIFCKTNQALQVAPDPGNQNFEDFIADKNGKLTLVFKKNIDKLDATEAGKFILRLENLLTKTLLEYTC